MKFEDEVSGHCLTDVAYAMRLTRRIEDHVIARYLFTEGGELTLQYNDGHIVRIDVRLVARPG